MATGEKSPIVEAIAACELLTTAEIRVHLSRGRFEKDAYARAKRLFMEFGMHRTTDRNAVLIYVNIRTRRFAIVSDEGLLSTLEPRAWDHFSTGFREELRSTHPENAISLLVRGLGLVLAMHFPKEQDLHEDESRGDQHTQDHA